MIKEVINQDVTNFSSFILSIFNIYCKYLALLFNLKGDKMTHVANTIFDMRTVTSALL